MTASKAHLIRYCCNVGLFAALLPLLIVGCVEHRRYRNMATIPKRCMHALTVDDFTRPCSEIKGKPNEAMCDQVHIRFACVDYGSQK